MIATLRITVHAVVGDQERTVDSVTLACDAVPGDQLDLRHDRLSDLTGLRVVGRTVGEAAVVLVCEAWTKERDRQMRQSKTEEPASKPAWRPKR